METGSIIGNIDVAQVVLYAFWIFFAMLVLYLRREDKREGYPLESDRRGGVAVTGYPHLPRPKSFRLADGNLIQRPGPEAAQPELAMEPAAKWPGAPMIPTGNPMLDGVGPAAYAMRAETPELTLHGDPKIVPIRSVSGYNVADESPDPRGMTVVDAQGKTAGTIVDLWIDRSEMIFRYLEAEAGENQNRVLIPITLARISRSKGTVTLASISHEQLAQAPRPAHETQVSLREEDRICAYFASGHLYAFPARSESLL